MQTIKFFLLCMLPMGVLAQLTPVQNLGLQTVTIEVPARFTGLFPAGRQLQIPAGYKVRVFHAGGMAKPRFMAFSPSGVLHVSDMRNGGTGRVYALPDANHDGIADTSYIVSQGYTNNHDIRFYNGHLYVTESTRVWECTDANGDGVYETKTIFIDSIGDNNTTGHYTRTIVFDSLNQKLYLSIGSTCNACRETKRAIIEQYNINGTGKRTYATGVRNAVGMTQHPVTGRIWANNNGNDNQGNELPPEWIDVLRDGGFYGHPFAYGNQVWMNMDAAADYQAMKPITAVDSQNVARMLMPAALVRAHSAPMAIQFLNSSFPGFMQKGFITALRGSWNTTAPNAYRGYKVIYAHLSSDTDTTVDYVADLCSGFLTDSINRVYWGRPVGLAVDGQGNIYISSDENSRVILQLYPDGPNGIEPPSVPDVEVHAYPNPFSSQLQVQFTLRKDTRVSFIVTDITGKEIFMQRATSFGAGEHEMQLPLADLSNGIYFLQVQAGDVVVWQKVQCVK